MHPMQRNFNAPVRPGETATVQSSMPILWRKADPVHPACSGNQPGCQGQRVPGRAGAVDGAGAQRDGDQAAGKSECLGCGKCEQEGVRG